MTTNSEKQICFVICPLGEDGSETRKRSDEILELLIKPIVEMEFEYSLIRADRIDTPGVITTQIIQYIIDSHLVIADLTDQNANVFYELAIRHAIKKPYIQLIKAGQKIPFDVAPTRTIYIDDSNLSGIRKCEDGLRKQISNIQKYPDNVDSPITQAIALSVSSKSDDPVEKRTVEILKYLNQLGKGLHNQQRVLSAHITKQGEWNVYLNGQIDKIISNVEPKPVIAPPDDIDLDPDLDLVEDEDFFVD